jgi:hypothetical protein
MGQSRRARHVPQDATRQLVDEGSGEAAQAAASGVTGGSDDPMGNAVRSGMFRAADGTNCVAETFRGRVGSMAKTSAGAPTAGQTPGTARSFGTEMTPTIFPDVGLSKTRGFRPCQGAMRASASLTRFHYQR